MALPTSGPMTAAMINAELGRAANAAFSLNGAAERALAGVSSGAISMASFYGKSSEIVVNMAAGGSAITLESLFSAADWASDTQKRVILPAGAERGNSANTNAAVTIGTNAWGGNLIFEVRGTISGRGGAANSGVGGNAFQANRVGNANQKLTMILTGTLRGGGGGGGKGGAGGGGSTTTTVREPASGWSQGYADGRYWMALTVGGNPGNTAVMWDNQAMGYVAYNTTVAAIGGYTYYRGPLFDEYSDDGPGYFYNYQSYRTSTASAPTSGGAGGNGGAGEGYGQARSGGSTGSAGGANAGAGGTGGAGGLYGATGGIGATGANGNASNGAAGAAGGLAGYGLLGTANVTLTNSGTIQGRTG
ncbi:hypothetical protein CPT_Pasto_053 [Rhizobium phage Pasto]|uniref:Uncharacterized protein n=1 Tax=Rhizobium phage Pasto TaxID=2767575 RepID=A0A7S6R830_9CAUD|nr:hypothetical protein CPT_Pasto_053 [Rhizobium phage Pasto]